MLAIIAIVCFAVAFVLKFLAVATGSVDLVALLVIAGLAFVAAHLAFPLPRRT